MDTDSDQRDALVLATIRPLLANGRARRLRLDSGLSLREAAAAVGTSSGQISRWERGSNRPTSRAGSALQAYGALLSELATLREERGAGD